jgi:CMP-N,N'-diacetyllegionaminic acid synthase
LNNKNKKEPITIALIAARMNSKGVKNKNLLKFRGEEITKTAVNLAMTIKRINRIVLSSDSNIILELIKKNKKLIKIKRKKKLAQDQTPMLPVIKNAINYFEKKIKKVYVSKVVIFDPTAPLRNKQDIENALNLFDKKKPDLLVSVHKANHNPYFSILEKNKNNYQLSKLPKKNPGSRQTVPEVFEINTIAWIYSRKAIFVENRRIPKKTQIFLTPNERSIDIDNKDDIEKIKNYMKKNVNKR